MLNTTMINSLPVLLAALAFIAFGYLTLVRIFWKRQNEAEAGETLKIVFRNSAQIIHRIGGSALFATLPAISLLLFWGWGPALLWLVIFHLIIELLINIRVSTTAENSIVEALASDKPNQIALSAVYWQCLMMFLAAMILSQLAIMIDQQSGLFWTLIFLLPINAILRHSNVPARLAAGVLFAFSLVLADTLGVAVYGSWPLFGTTFDWLVLNNSTVLALGLLVAGALLCEKRDFNHNLTSLSGYLSIVLLLILVISLLWLRPELDAPVLSGANNLAADAQATKPPSGTGAPLFIGLCLMMFSSLLAILMRLPGVDDDVVDDRPVTEFGQLQALGLYQLLLSVALVLALSAALGIGAWNTHYLNWSWQIDLVRHFELALTTLFSTIAGHADIGSRAHTVFMAGASFIALALLLRCFRQLSFNHTATKPNHQAPAEIKYSEWLLESRLLQAIVIYILSCFFISHGISIDLWLIGAMLAWFILLQYLFSLVLAVESVFDLFYNSLCLALLVLGLVQIIFISLHWWQTQQYLFVAAAVILLVTGLRTWFKPVQEMLNQFRMLKDSKLFD